MVKSALSTPGKFSNVDRYVCTLSFHVATCCIWVGMLVSPYATENIEIRKEVEIIQTYK